MELHDIFPTAEIVEYSLQYLLGFIFLLPLVFYILYRFAIKKKKNRAYYLNILKHYPKENAKYTAHLFSYYGAYIITNEKEKILCAEINKVLYPSKYTQEYHSVPQEAQKVIALLLGTKYV